MKKNEGFSLIELIVTVAVMAILSAGVVTIVLSRSGREANSASQKISTVLSETRAQALAKENAWMKISYDTDKGYVIETSYSGDVVLGKKIEISYTTEGGSSVLISGSGSLILSYKRASGEFYPMGSIDAAQKFIPGSDYCDKIKVSAGAAHHYELTLIKETGRNELEKVN